MTATVAMRDRIARRRDSGSPATGRKVRHRRPPASGFEAERRILVREEEPVGGDAVRPAEDVDAELIEAWRIGAGEENCEPGDYGGDEPRYPEANENDDVRDEVKDAQADGETIARNLRVGNGDLCRIFCLA